VAGLKCPPEIEPKKHKDVNSPNPTNTSSSAALTMYKNVIVPSISAANLYFKFQDIFFIDVLIKTSKLSYFINSIEF
jgi:hypothetical protein